MIEFTHETTQYRVKPENAQAYRAALDKPKKHKIEALSSVNLTRQYPAFLAGHTTTAEYVERFQSQFDNLQHPISHDCANYHKPAPMLDPTQPEVLEEMNPDYTPPQPKPKKRKSAEVMDVIESALKLIRAGDINMAEFVLRRAIP
jgi:hypothetical protein